MFWAINKLRKEVLEILLPKFCLGCGREGEYICRQCQIFFSEAPPSKEVFSVWEYEGLVEELIEKIKFEGAYDIINELMSRAWEKIDLKLPLATYLTYVPMWPPKERKRGFNQAELLARTLSQLLKGQLPAQNRQGLKQDSFEVLALLAKVKDNRSQVGLTPQEREENVKGVFAFRGSFIPQNVLLVDDVYTTGATVRECVKVLKKAGVKNVWIFTLARKF